MNKNAKRVLWVALGAAVAWIAVEMACARATRSIEPLVGGAKVTIRGDTQMRHRLLAYDGATTTTGKAVRGDGQEMGIVVGGLPDTPTPITIYVESALIGEEWFIREVAGETTTLDVLTLLSKGELIVMLRREGRAARVRELEILAKERDSERKQAEREVADATLLLRRAAIDQTGRVEE